jgi:hypothetical protein
MVYAGLVKDRRSTEGANPIFAVHSLFTCWEANMRKNSSAWWILLFAIVGFCGNAQAQTVTVDVDSSVAASWLRSDGGTGTTMPAGGPGVWNSRFVVAIPAGATNIQFTLNSFFPDDKGVVQLNGTTIGDAVIFGSNGAAAGPGTFDFGLGGGNNPYVYAGFVPGSATSLPNGTTTFTLVAYINDTGVADPSSVPLATAFISGFSLTGTLSYVLPLVAGPAPTAVPTLSEWTMLLMITLVIVGAVVQLRPR